MDLLGELTGLPHAWQTQHETLDLRCDVFAIRPAFNVSHGFDLKHQVGAPVFNALDEFPPMLANLPGVGVQVSGQLAQRTELPIQKGGFESHKNQFINSALAAELHSGVCPQPQPQPHVLNGEPGVLWSLYGCWLNSMCPGNPRCGRNLATIGLQEITAPLASRLDRLHGGRPLKNRLFAAGLRAQLA